MKKKSTPRPRRPRPAQTSRPSVTARKAVPDHAQQISEELASLREASPVCQRQLSEAKERVRVLDDAVTGGLARQEEIRTQLRQAIRDRDAARDQLRRSRRWILVSAICAIIALGSFAFGRIGR